MQYVFVKILAFLADPKTQMTQNYLKTDRNSKNVQNSKILCFFVIFSIDFVDYNVKHVQQRSNSVSKWLFPGDKGSSVIKKMSQNDLKMVKMSRFLIFKAIFLKFSAIRTLKPFNNN